MEKAIAAARLSFFCSSSLPKLTQSPHSNSLNLRAHHHHHHHHHRLRPSQSHCSRRHAFFWGSLCVPSLQSLLQLYASAEEYLDALEEQRSVRLFEEATRSVVSIQDIQLLNPKSEKGSAAYQNFTTEGTGSGFIWDRLGHIVTNYHVVAKLASDISGRQRSNVSLLGNNGTVSVYEADLVGIDPSHDLAVLKIDVPEICLQPLPVGTSLDLRVGQNCYAIGNPYGLEHTLTSGVISGLGREIPSPIGKPILGAIQTDASINAGNSGGPLLDSFGRVIGVSTATFTRQGTGVSSGVNFALPIDLVRGIIPYLIVHGTILSQRPDNGYAELDSYMITNKMTESP